MEDTLPSCMEVLLQDNAEMMVSKLEARVLRKSLPVLWAALGLGIHMRANVHHVVPSCACQHDACMLKKNYFRYWMAEIAKKFLLLEADNRPIKPQRLTGCRQ